MKKELILFICFIAFLNAYSSPSSVFLGECFSIGNNSDLHALFSNEKKEELNANDSASNRRPVFLGEYVSIGNRAGLYVLFSYEKKKELDVKVDTLNWDNLSVRVYIIENEKNQQAILIELIDSLKVILVKEAFKVKKKKNRFVRKKLKISGFPPVFWFYNMDREIYIFEEYKFTYEFRPSFSAYFIILPIFPNTGSQLFEYIRK